MSADMTKDFDFQGLVEWYIGIITKKYAEFNGRARRKEFWYFFLCNLAIGIALGILSLIPFIGRLFAVVSWLFSLALLIPNLAVGFRRLHDTNRSGLWILLVLIPLVGAIILLVWAAMEGTAGENQYGPDPKGDGNNAKAEGEAGTAPAQIAAGGAEKPVFCGECGAKNERGTKFCGSCGKPIG